MRERGAGGCRDPEQKRVGRRGGQRLQTEGVGAVETDRPSLKGRDGWGLRSRPVLRSSATATRGLRRGPAQEVWGDRAIDPMLPKRVIDTLSLNLKMEAEPGHPSFARGVTVALSIIRLRPLRFLQSGRIQALTEKAQKQQAQAQPWLSLFESLCVFLQTDRRSSEAGHERLPRQS